MSDLYECRILKVSERTLPPAAGTKDIQSEFAQAITVAFPEEDIPDQIDLDTFISYVKKWSEKATFAEIREALEEPYLYDPSITDELEAKEDLLFYAELIGESGPFIGNNVLASIFPDQQHAAKAIEVEIELVTRHPDAGLPNEEFGYTSFFMTLMEGLEESSLYKRSEAPTWRPIDPKTGNPISFKEEGDSGAPMVVCAWAEETFKLRFNEDFEKAHEGKWWFHLIDYLEEPSDNLPYGYGRYKFMLTDPWFEALETDETFQSAAYHA